jgi:hypothetical protein
MADVKISQLPQAALPFTGSEVFPLVQNGVTVQAAIGGAGNVSLLRAIPVTSSEVIAVDSYEYSGDGGGGQFYGVTGALVGTYVDNGGSIIVPTGGDGSSAWLRVNEGYFTVKQFGAKGDGTTDDTTAIQNALTASSGTTLYFPAGTYQVFPLTVPSNSRIIFSGDATLRAIAGYTTFQRLLTLYRASNIVIEGNGGVIQMLKSEYTSGEFRHGVYIGGCTNVVINSLVVKDTGGDGFYIGPGATNLENSNLITLNNCVSDNARRNGLSITAAYDVWINGGEYKNTIGTQPGFGIDLEPNTSDNELYNINISNVSTSNNEHGSIQFVFGAHGATAAKNTSVNVTNCYSYNDGGTGTLIGIFGAYRTGLSPIFPVTGSVNISNCTIENCAGSAVQFFNGSPYVPHFNFNNLTVINCAANAAAVYNKSAINLYTAFDTQAVTGGPSNITFNDCYIVDNRAVPLMYAGVYMRSATTAGYARDIKNVLFNNIEILNPTNLNYVIQTDGTTTNTINIVNNNPNIYTAASSLSNAEQSIAGSIATMSVSGVLNLGSLGNLLGLELEFRAITNTFTVAPFTGQKILFAGLAAGAGLVLDLNTYIKLRATTAGWEVVSSSFPLLTGTGSPSGAVNPRFLGRMYFDTAASKYYISNGTTATSWALIGTTP